jgi:tape measure domain-containing protein
MSDDTESLTIAFKGDISDLRTATQKITGELNKVESTTASSSSHMSSSLHGVKGSFDALNGSSSSTSSSFQHFTSAEQHAGSATQHFASQVSEASSSLSGKFTSGIQHAGMSLLDLGSKLSLVGMGVAGLIQGGISLAGSLLGPVMSAESLGISFTTLMGSAEGATKEIKELNKFADITPFEPGPVQEYAAQLIGLGIDADQTIPIMTSLGDALFGIGHGTEAEMASVVDQIGKIRVAGVMTWGDISQLQTHGINVLDAMSRATGRTKEELRDMSSTGIDATYAIDALTRGIEMNPLYQGGMAKQASSLSGIMSTLTGYAKGALNSFLGLKDGMVVSGGIIDRVKTLLFGVSTALRSPAFQNFASGAGAAIGKAFDAIGMAGEYVGNVFKSLNLTEFKDAWGSLTGLLDDIGKRLLKVGDAFGGLASEANPLAEIIGHLAKGGLDLLTNALWGLDSILVDVDKVLSGAGGPVSELTGNFSEFGDQAWRIASMLGGQFADEFKFVGEQASQIGNWFADSGILGQVGQEFQNLGHILLDLAEIFVKGRGIILDVEEHAFAKFAPIIERVLPLITGLAVAIDTGVTEAFHFLTPYVLQAEEAFGKFADGVIDRVGPIVERWMPYLEKGAEELKQGWDAVFPYLQVIVGSAFQEIVGTVQVAWSLVSGIINVGLDLLNGDWKKGWEDVKATFQGVMDGINTFTGGSIDKLKESISNGLKEVETQFKPLLQGMAQIPGPAGDMAKNVLQAFGDMSEGAQTQTDEMKNSIFMNTVESQQDTIRRYEAMRQEIGKQLGQTTDETQRHALQQKLALISNAEDTAKNVLHRQVDMHKQTQAQQKKAKEDTSNIFTSMGANVQNIFAGMGTNIQTALGNIDKVIHTIIGNVTHWIQDRWHEAVHGVVDKFQWLYDHNYYFQALVDNIKGVVQHAKEWLQDRWEEIKGNVVNKWEEIKTDVSTKATELWDNISQPFKDAWDKYLGPPITGLWNTVTTTVDTWKTDAYQWGKDIIQKLIDGVNGMGEWLKNAISTIVSNALTGAGFHDIGLGTPTDKKKKTPGHARGIINNPVGHWAIVGEEGPELQYTPEGSSILPHSVYNNLLSGSMSLSQPPQPVYNTALASFTPQQQPLQGDSGEIHIHNHNHIYLDGREMTDVIMDKVVRRLRSQGGKMLSL